MLLKLKIDRTAYNIYNSAVGTLAVGSTLRGIFEIAGTDSPFEKVFWILGLSMIALSGIIYICRAIRYRKTKNKKPGS